jgi:hypothetical protein
MAILGRWHKEGCCILLLLSVHAGLLAWIDWHTSPSLTEAAHMAAGLYTWHTQNCDVYCVNPPLVRAFATIPVLAANPEYDFAAYSPNFRDRCEWSLGSAFVTANRTDSVRWYFAMARWACIPFSLLGGYACYRFAKDLYGHAAGIVAATLWCFSPMLLGLGATICPETAAAGVGIFAIYLFRRWLLAPSWNHVLEAGALLGILLLTKLTWIVALAIWPLLWFIWRLWPPPASTSHRAQLPPLRQLGGIIAVSLCVLNFGYGCEGTFQRFGEYRFVSNLLSGEDVSAGNLAQGGHNRFALTWLSDVPMPFPSSFIQGIDIQRYDFEQGLTSYLRGEWADHGWWYYYLYALLIKTPLGTLGLVLSAIAVTLFGTVATDPTSSSGNCGIRQTTSWQDEMTVLVPLFAIVIFVSSQSGFSAHSRYVAPALPFLFVWTGKVASVFEWRPLTDFRLAVAAAIVVMLTWSVSSSVSIYPHSLAYFNELAALLPTPADATYPKPRTNQEKQGILTQIKHALAAGPRNGPRHLLGSNIDCNQDLFYLRGWLDMHPDVKLNGLSYHGSYPARLAGVSAETPYPPSFSMKEQDAGITEGGAVADHGVVAQSGPKPGWYALGVDQIYGREHQYLYFLNYEPVATAGYSIYIYHITLDEANRVRRELGLKEIEVDEERRTKESNESERVGLKEGKKCPK